MSLRKIIVAFLCLGSPGMLLAKETIYVKNTTSLLSAPSEKTAKVLKNLELNEIVTVIYIEENLDIADLGMHWTRIQTADGHEGYVRLMNLSKEKMPEPEYKVMARAIEKKSFVNADALYVRSEPSRSSAEKGMLTRNSSVTVLAYSDQDDYIDGHAAKWAHVQASDELDGWVFSAYLSDEPANINIGPGNEPKEDPEHINSGSSKSVKPPLLAIRDEPTKYGTIIGRVKQGKSVRIIERQNAWESLAGLRSVWVKVRYDDLEGWVFGGFLSSSGYTMSSDSLDKPFMIPLEQSSYRRTSPYGPRKHPISGQASFHSGVDLAAGGGTPIYSAADGVVEVQSDNTGYGMLTVIRHDNGLVTYYCHQSKRHKREGDKVQAGDLIGEVGTTGNSTGPHLHFEVRTNYNDTHFNPDLYVPFPEVQEAPSP